MKTLTITLTINNQSFTEGIFPHILKIAQISQIHKYEDRFTVTKYRPISLLSTFSKTFEKFFGSRICLFLCKQKSINSKH